MGSIPVFMRDTWVSWPNILSIVYLYCSPILEIFGNAYQSAELPTKILAAGQL